MFELNQIQNYLPVCMGIGIFIAVAAVILVVLRSYQTVGPDEVLVVSGFRGPRYINNGGTFVLPILNTTRRIDVRVISIVVENDVIPTKDHIKAVVSWVAKAKFVVDDQQMLANAAQLFANMDRREIVREIEETLSQNIREIVATLTATELHSMRQQFVARVQEVVADDLRGLGVRIISMGIQELTDEDGYYESLGAPEREAKKAEAEIAKAENERNARIKAAQSGQEAEQAELDAKRNIIAQKEELGLREVAMLEKTELAKAKTQNAVQTERAAAEQKRYHAEVIIPAQADAEKRRIEAEADKVVQTTSSLAEAEKLRIDTEAANAAAIARNTTDADNQRRSAEAQRYSLQEQAQAQLAGEQAKAAALQAMKEAEAEGLRAMREAEASGIRQTLSAQAEGESALAKALAEKAQALAAEGQIAVMQEVALALVAAIKESEIARASAMGQLGSKMDITFLGGNQQAGDTNPILDMIEKLPLALRNNELSSLALGQLTVEEILKRAMQLLDNSGSAHGNGAN